MPRHRFAPVAAKREQQKCLRCRSMFWTHDKRKNHICPTCTKLNQELSDGVDHLFSFTGGVTQQSDEDWHGCAGGQE
jgi:PHP family Zn ribbon phosphoesterase